MLNTGFSEITYERIRYNGSSFWYCEIALTGQCNFSCKYCKRFNAEINIDSVYNFIEKEKDLRHVQLTGGEPTKSEHLSSLCKFIKDRGIKLGLSTNGTADLDFYKSLGVDMFSISLDDYDIKILEERGYKNVDKIIKNIEELSKSNYVNIGLVVDSINVERTNRIVKYILNLGVNDIKISTNTNDEVLPKFDDSDYSKYPILNYRVQRFRKGRSMRGIGAGESFKCEISKNDISIVGSKHYPCLVYFREGGEAIGDMNGNIKEERLLWYKFHKPYEDPICSRFCMDFKCDFNREKNEKENN